MLRRKRILVTGSAGSIGSELVRQLAKNNKVYCLDIDEVTNFDLIEELKQKGHWVHGRTGDIRDKETIEDVFSDFKPQIVFHAAALKVVTPGEWHPLEHIKTNVYGTFNVLAACKKWPCKMVLISSDKAATSSSVYGLTKRLAEVLARNQGFVVVRFGNCMGSRGSVLPLWQQQLDRGELITVTDARCERYMMTIPQAVSLVIKAAEQGKGGEILILDTGKKINVLELAKKIIDGNDIKMIGLRDGETLSETWMTLEEEKVALKKGDYWIIPKL